jgi:arylsulfatase A-like enzyme
MKSMAGAGKIVYYECGAIGQHGIVSGSPKGTEYFNQFRTSRLGTLFVDGKYVRNSVDHSDSATYWVLLGEYGVSLQDISADGINPTQVEKANEAKFAAASKRIHDELLRRSMIAAKPIAKVAPQAIEAIDLLYSGKVDWNAESGTVTFSSSGHMPDSKEGFFWNVPPSVKQIVINSDVTVQGAFRVKFRDAKNPLVVKGLDRKTSVIVGTPQQKWTENAGIAESDKWRYGAINVVEDAIVHVSNLTSKNPRGYHISGYANKAVIHVDGCELLDTRGGDNNNSDGFIGAAGSSIRNSFISTADDAIKVYHDITIENVTIEQHRNGAPLQFGWGGENDVATASIKNLAIRGVSADGKYNLAPLTWSGGRGGVRNVSIDGLTIDVQGKIYGQANKSWQPIGLMLVKPTQCTLNLAVKRAKIGDLPHGLNAAQGSVRIEPSIDSLNELPRATASDKVVSPATRPNVIVILTDDQGWSDLGCQGIQKDVRTPHIDALAARGVRCTAAYVTAPQCSPSRAALMTGRYQQRFGIDTIPDMPLPSEAVTIAERLQPLGYRTGFVGKWHLEPNVTCVDWIKRELPEMAGKPRAQVRIPWDKMRPYSPSAQGFDEYFWGELRNYRVNYELDGHETDEVDISKDPDTKGAPVVSNTKMKQVENKDFRIDVQTAAAVSFIERNHTAPFYLQLNYYGPHTPLEATQKYLDRFPSDMPIRRRYALAMIAAIDDGVGRVVEKLTEHGLIDNTLIVVTSDNGAPLKMTKPDSPLDGDAGGWDGSLNEPWVGEKGMLSEGGIRVPMIWSLPSQLPSGKTYDWPVSTLDIAPSVLQLAGGNHSEVMLDNTQNFDGINLIPAMNDIQNPPTRSLYFRFWDQAAMRRGKWKYIYVGDGRRYLFDLESDQHEHKNLIDKHTELAEKLHQDLGQWCKGLKPAGLPNGDKMRERNWYNFHFDGIPAPK